MKRNDTSTRRKLFIIIVVLFFLWLTSYLISLLFSDTPLLNTEKVAFIPIQGPITSFEQPLYKTSTGVKSDTILASLEQANKDNNVKGIILEINSPGGTVVASKEVMEAVKASPKPVVAWIREIGTSGAYWIATAADSIIADHLSITGSIGVNAGYLEFSGLMEEYGVGYEALTSAEHKDTGTPFKKLTPEERAILQEKIDLIHDYFVQDVSTNRHLDTSTVTELATGIYYLGVEARDLGLVDKLGGKDDAVRKIEELTNTTNLQHVTYEEKEPGLFDIFTYLEQEATPPFTTTRHPSLLSVPLTPRA